MDREKKPLRKTDGRTNHWELACPDCRCQWAREIESMMGLNVVFGDSRNRVGYYGVFSVLHVTAQKISLS